MKKLLFIVVLCSLNMVSYNLQAEEMTEYPEAVAPAETVSKAPAAAEAPAEAPQAVEATVEIPAVVETSPVAEAPVDTTAIENLEFISGEVTGMDEAAKSLTVKLYGETEDETAEKSLTVKVDETTDITDGEKDRDLKSLAAGTEVDVEYDPASNKATYIFVY